MTSTMGAYRRASGLGAIRGIGGVAKSQSHPRTLWSAATARRLSQNLDRRRPAGCRGGVSPPRAAFSRVRAGGTPPLSRRDAGGPRNEGGELEVLVDHVAGGVDGGVPVGEEERRLLLDRAPVEAVARAGAGEEAEDGGLDEALEVDGGVDRAHLGDRVDALAGIAGP